MSKIKLSQSLGLKIGKIVRWIRTAKQELQNQKLGRQLVGQDREGNKYYQYYSYYGLPTRRQISFIDPKVLVLNDLVYYRWLYKFELDPPTEYQKQQFYLEQKLRKKRALQWDRKDAQLVENYKRQRQQILLRNAALRELQLQSEKEEPLTIKTKRQNEK